MNQAQSDGRGPRVADPGPRSCRRRHAIRKTSITLTIAGGNAVCRTGGENRAVWHIKKFSVNVSELQAEDHHNRAGLHTARSESLKASAAVTQGLWRRSTTRKTPVRA